MEETKTYVWSVFSGNRDDPVFLGGALCIDRCGHLLTTIFGTGITWNQRRKKRRRTAVINVDIKVRSPLNNDYDARLIHDWSEFGLLLYQVVGEDEEVFDFLSIDDNEGNGIDLDDDAFCFVHQEGLSHGFLKGLCSYPSPLDDIELVSNENSSCGDPAVEELYNYNSAAVETSPPYRMLRNILDVRTFTALPLLSKLHLDLPLLHFSGFGRLTADTSNGSSGCPVFKSDNMKLVGLILFYKNAACLVVPLNIIQQARVVLSSKITLKDKDDIEEKSKGDEGKGSGSGRGRASRRGRKRRGSRGGGGSMGGSSGFRSAHLQNIIGVGFGRSAKVDPFLTRKACIALRRLSEEDRKKLLASNGTCIFSALESLVACLWLLDKTWNSAADKAVGAFYALHPAPESNAARIVMKSQNSVFHPDESGDLEHEVEDGTGRGQTTVQAGKLGRYLFVMSHVAMHQLAYHESCVRKIQKQKAKKDRQDGGIDTELGVAASEDAILYALADRAEREILSGASHEKNLLGYCAPSLSKICINFNLMQKNPDLQAAASLALCRFMIVNAAFCEANLQLLFSQWLQQELRRSTMLDFLTIVDGRCIMLGEGEVTYKHALLHFSCCNTGFREGGNKFD